MFRSFPGVEPTPAGPARFRALPEAFFEQTAPGPDSVGGRDARLVHPILVDACFAVAGADGRPTPCRRSSISGDGTPLIYSFKAVAGAGPAGFRCVGEPGGFAIDTAAQIGAALAATDRICAVLGWEKAAGLLRAAAADLLPADLVRCRRWWGGLWVGLDAEPDGVALKLYVNLRPLAAAERWTRVARGFRRLGIDPARARAVAGAFAEPMGACFVAAAGRIVGARLYLGLEHAGSDQVAALCGGLVPLADAPVRDFCDLFTAEFGPFGRHSVAVAADFAVAAPGRAASPGAARAKAELCLELLDEGDRRRALAWFAGLGRRFGLNDAPCRAALPQAKRVFGGVEGQYVSLGAYRSGRLHATAYVRPVGLRLPHGLAEEDPS